MKNKITKVIVTFSLVLSFLFAGIFTLGTSYVADTNEGLLLAHDGPSHDVAKY